MEYNIIYLTSKVILSKKQFESWNDIQELYEDYKASLKFETIEEVNDFLSSEYRIDEESTKKMTKNIYQEESIELIFLT
ncbi:hypothetical protein IRZ83_05035 [Flavobacterium sp. JLP]|uniref:hypothetical protein n=1 Tax=Flavobacterium sp. JLP TaxID=2783793 RepID=UPI00188D98D9|nr:hypothetical protein [Flavobacterium sp. JLP]MBF4506025.1 hypothetical protein [Flavobacterium sp. JLP]